jgi:AP-2 complex subunit alpha
MVLYCSIRRRALDLLYGMCDVTNAKEIVEELLQVTNLFRLLLQEENLTLLFCC